jgi:hypothetical protein
MSSYIITVTYGGNNLFTTIQQIVDCLPPIARVTSSWSKRGNTLTATITDIQPEDIVMLKLKFDIKTNQLQTANSQ